MGVFTRRFDLVAETFRFVVNVFEAKHQKCFLIDLAIWSVPESAAKLQIWTIRNENELGYAGRGCNRRSATLNLS